MDSIRFVNSMLGAASSYLHGNYVAAPFMAHIISSNHLTFRLQELILWDMIRIISGISFFFFLLLLIYFTIPPDRKCLYPDFNSSNIYDRNGVLLRKVLSRDYKTSVWKDLKDIAPEMIKATIIKEDSRFLLHKGIDIIALSRALYDNLRSRRIQSGGSTITMQVAKIVLGNNKRNVFAKLLEMVYALKLELHLGKAEILEIYLNRAPYGYQTYGVEAGSQFYFQKPSHQLSLSEACIMAIIPEAPTILNPYKSSDRILEERNRLLNKLLKARLIDSLQHYCALSEPVVINKNALLFEAPHFVDFLLDKYNSLRHSNIISTIDISLQRNLEKMAFCSIENLTKHNVGQVSVLVMDTKTGEILAMVGSKDYFDENEGQVNGCISLRQPGSSIKPFLYALALINQIPISYLMNDTITEFRLSDGTVFAPRNFGEKYHRWVRAREALASSFNVPAVHILERLGVENFYNFLTRLGIKSLFKKPNFYGLSLSLGGAEVKLLELVNAYRAIANTGFFREYKFLRNEKTKAGERVFSEEVAYIITNVLSDNASRIKAFGDDSPLNLPFPCAVKTGTTKNFKDNWCIGYTKRYTAGVWVGNFDGSPMNGISGISGAAPLFRDIMIELHRDEYPEDFEKPKTLMHAKICSSTGMLAGKVCPVIEEIFIPGTEPNDTCSYCGSLADSRKGFSGIIEVEPVRAESVPNSIGKFRILYPQNDDIYKLDPHIPYSNQAIVFKVQIDSGISSFSLYLNKRKICENTSTYTWQPKPGKYELEAKAQDASKTYEDKVVFTVY